MSTFLHYVHCKDALLDCSAPGGERCESLTWVDEIGTLNEAQAVSIFIYNLANLSKWCNLLWWTIPTESLSTRIFVNMQWTLRLYMSLQSLSGVHCVHLFPHITSKLYLIDIEMFTSWPSDYHRFSCPDHQRPKGVVLSSICPSVPTVSWHELQ